MTLKIFFNFSFKLFSVLLRFFYTFKHNLLTNQFNFKL